MGWTLVFLYNASSSCHISPGGRIVLRMSEQRRNGQMSAPFLTLLKVLSRKASPHPSRKLIQHLESGSWLLWADTPLHRQDGGESVGSGVSSGPLTHRRAPAPSVRFSLPPEHLVVVTGSQWQSRPHAGCGLLSEPALPAHSALCSPEACTCLPLLCIFKDTLCFNHVPLPSFCSFHECIPFCSFYFNFSKS